MSIRRFLPLIFVPLICAASACRGENGGSASTADGDAPGAMSAADSGVVDATVTVDTQATPGDTSDNPASDTTP